MVTISETANANTDAKQLPAPHDRPELVQRRRAAQIDYNAAQRKGGGMAKLMAWIKVLIAKLNLFPPMRAFGIYTMRHGPLMAAGSAYNMFFAVAAMLVAGFSILGLVISGNTGLQKIIVQGVAATTPGLIVTSDGHGLVKSEQLFSMGTGLSITLVISLAGLILTSLGWIAGLREGVRGVFDLLPLQGNGVLIKLKDILTLFVLGIVIVVTSVISFGVAGLLNTLIENFHLDKAVFAPLTWVVSTLFLLLIDLSVATLLFRYSAGLRLPRRIMFETALIAAVGSTVLRSLSSLVLSNVAGKNPLLAPFSVILGLFVWFYFLSQVYLIASGWGAMRVADKETARRLKGVPALSRMHGVVQRRYGDYGVLSYTELATPEPNSRQVRVRVEAAGVDAGTWYAMSGKPKLRRFFKNGLIPPGDRVLGQAFAGVVESVGSRVTALKPGDAVIGSAPATYAEFALARPEDLVTKPGALSFAKAAALPVSAGAALKAVNAAGPIKGKKVLILGAGGGVGHYLVQLGYDAEAKVTGVCSTSKVDFVKSLGADEVLNYRTDEPTQKRKRQWDVIIDAAGTRSLSKMQQVLAPEGALVLLARHRATGALSHGKRRGIPLLRNLLTSQRIIPVEFSETPQDVQHLAQLANLGVLRPHVGATYPLPDAEEAIAQAHAARVPGKIVLKVGERE